MGEVIMFDDIRQKNVVDILKDMAIDSLTDFPFTLGYVVAVEPGDINYPNCLVNVDQEENGSYFVTVHFRTKAEALKFKRDNGFLFVGAL